MPTYCAVAICPRQMSAAPGTANRLGKLDQAASSGSNNPSIAAKDGFASRISPSRVAEKIPTGSRSTRPRYGASRAVDMARRRVRKKTERTTDGKRANPSDDLAR